MQKQKMTIEISSQKPRLGFLVALLPLLSFIGCSLLAHDSAKDDCKIRTYLTGPMLDYLTTQYGSEKSPRIGIMPFDAPAGFARWGKDEPSYGQELASKFQLELQQSGQLGLVELYNQDNWPGKREEFFTGNYRALDLARKAGYEVILLGSLQMQNPADNMTLHTKVIDVQNGVTAWSAQTTLTSRARARRESLADWGFGEHQPNQFDFIRRTDAIVQCTVAEMLKSSESQIKDEEPTRRPVRSGAMDDTL